TPSELGTSCHDALLLRLVELCRLTSGFPTHDKVNLPPVAEPTLMPPTPVPLITKLSKLKFPPLPIVTNASPAPVITPFKLLDGVEPAKPPLLVTVRFFQF